MRDSCQRAGFSLTAAQALEKLRPQRQQRRMPTTAGNYSAHGDVVPVDKLCNEALRALNDFPYFQRRYLGRVPLPWQEDAALKIVEWLESPEEEYVVLNAPPGAGKSTLFTHDIPTWLIVRNRAIRILLGAVTGRIAAQYTDRIRTTLERTIPAQGKVAEVAAGRAYDAEATLAGDYGRFKPLGPGLWTKEAFIVAQPGDVGIVEKEPTCQSYGFDSEYIGNRVDFANWDDLQSKKRQRSEMSREQLVEDWDDVAEARLEPNGLLALTGQRLGPQDIYRHAMDKQVPDEIDDDGEILSWKPKYRRLIYPVHWVDRCQPQFHKKGAPAWPEGCLLAPNRTDFRKVSGLQRDNRNFETVWQQQDTDPANVLVQKDWVYGDNGFPGCVDRERDRIFPPRQADGTLAWETPLFSALTVDPSPSKYWGIQWWVYQPTTERRYLMDLYKGYLKAPEFLEYNPQTRSYSGLLEEWWQTSKDVGLRFTHLVVEINAAQRFLVQYKFFNDWLRLRGVQLVNHTTHRNKSDPAFGVWTVQDQWRLGRISLPWKANSEGKRQSRYLIYEVTGYDGDNYSGTTDQLMAHWFFEFQLPKLYHPDTPPSVSWRPSGLRGRG